MARSSLIQGFPVGPSSETCLTRIAKDRGCFGRPRSFASSVRPGSATSDKPEVPITVVVAGLIGLVLPMPSSADLGERMPGSPSKVLMPRIGLCERHDRARDARFQTGNSVTRVTEF